MSLCDKAFGEIAGREPLPRKGFRAEHPPIAVAWLPSWLLADKESPRRRCRTTRKEPPSVNKSEFIAQVAAQAGVSAKDTAAVLNAMEDVIGATVKKGDKITITGFFSASRTSRPAGTARNPRTGETVKTKARKNVKLTAGGSLKKVVNGESPAAKLKKA
jgi:DNA-binding protein HU-beta